MRKRKQRMIRSNHKKHGNGMTDLFQRTEREKRRERERNIRLCFGAQPVPIPFLYNQRTPQIFETSGDMEKLSLLGRKADPGVFKVESLEDKTERRLKGVYGVELEPMRVKGGPIWYSCARGSRWGVTRGAMMR